MTGSGQLNSASACSSQPSGMHPGPVRTSRFATKLIATFDLGMSEVWRSAERLVAEPMFTVRRRAVESALLTSLSLTTDEVRKLVA